MGLVMGFRGCLDTVGSGVICAHLLGNYCWLQRSQAHGHGAKGCYPLKLHCGPSSSQVEQQGHRLQAAAWGCRRRHVILHS